MLSKSKIISIKGTSTVSIDGKDTVVMTMNASINEDGSMSVNKFVQNKEKYIANKDTVDADYAEFEAYASELLGVE